jgi:hypothetical protein
MVSVYSLTRFVGSINTLAAHPKPLDAAKPLG